ncbi:MAG: hypothetical protein FWE76_03940 [Symbiobacteriaceae bacterium]|nr:hypothetical protein [Symbiobacteriaceae bacterium]
MHTDQQRHAQLDRGAVIADHLGSRRNRFRVRSIFAAADVKVILIERGGRLLPDEDKEAVSELL